MSWPCIGLQNDKPQTHIEIESSCSVCCVQTSEGIEETGHLLVLDHYVSFRSKSIKQST